MNQKGIGYKLNEATKCQAHDLVFVPLTGRCETPEIAARLIEQMTARGVGFLSNGEDYAPEFYDDWDWDWNFWDYNFGDSGGNDYSYLPDLPTGNINFPVTLPGPGVSAGSPFELISDYLRDFLSGFVDTVNTNAPYKTGPSNQNDNVDWNWGLPANQQLPNILDNQPGAPVLPKPCYGPTYHPYPIGHPQQDLCVPLDDGSQATKKKQAAIKRQGQQQQARQQQKQQQAANKTCPPKNWRNPKTGKCELIPTCPAGAKFDQVTAQCLTASQRLELYGQQGNWLWWIVGGVLFLFFVSRKNDSSRLRRKR